MNSSDNSDYVPFVKWVGGKRRVINTYLYKYIPKDFKTYIEPFLGGGAMLSYLRPKKAIINDINSELINTYKSIKNDYKAVINNLNFYKENHSQKLYYKVRRNIEQDNFKNAARFIYLNKTCFNGMYRVNSNGEFNVPWNNKNKSKLKLYDLKNIKWWNEYLNKNKITILNKSYLDVLDRAKKDDFVYCDPPYDYELDTKGFDSYNQDAFGQKNQILLANKLKELDKKKVKWMLSNHNTKLINELYDNFHIIPITTNRMINSKANKRKGTGKEVVVINYEI